MSPKEAPLNGSTAASLGGWGWLKNKHLNRKLKKNPQNSKFPNSNLTKFTCPWHVGPCTWLFFPTLLSKAEPEATQETGGPCPDSPLSRHRHLSGHPRALGLWEGASALSRASLSKAGPIRTSSLLSRWGLTLQRSHILEGQGHRTMQWGKGCRDSPRPAFGVPCSVH